MKGILHNIESDWFVVYKIDNKEILIPILQESFDIDSTMKYIIKLKKGKEVKFELIEGGKARLL